MASNVSPVLAASARSTRPDPKSNGSAGVAPSSLTTSWMAVVISADLIWPGDHSGRSAAIRAADPAMCGDDIDVPAIAWKYSPGGPSVLASGVGVWPARICTPGAVMSGLMNRPPGPRDEKAAITSPSPSRFSPAVNEPVTFVRPCMNARNSRPSARCTVGSQWLSVSMSASVGLYRIMPTAPPCRTLKPLSTRALPPRWQATILPVNVPGGAGLVHRAS